MSEPIIITGMHRSGTSLTASFIQAIGVNIGQNMFPADIYNVKGYFEDIDFLEFQRSLLQKSCPPEDAGWSDWGWTESEILDRRLWSSYIPEAKKLIAGRQGGIWGWKDPRTSLLLEFWHQLLPNARYILVYRSPWDVADSILRQNRGVFPLRPEYTLRVWGFYNRHLLSFYREHRACCILMNINSFVQQPTRLLQLLEKKLGLIPREPGDEAKFAKIYDANLLRSLPINHPMVRLINHLMPELISLLKELDQIADIPRGDRQLNADPRTILPIEALPLLMHYQSLMQQQQSHQEQSQLRSEVAQLRSELDRLTLELMTIKRSRSWKLARKLAHFGQKLRFKLGQK